MSFIVVAFLFADSLDHNSGSRADVCKEFAIVSPSLYCEASLWTGASTKQKQDLIRLIRDHFIQDLKPAPKQTEVLNASPRVWSVYFAGYRGVSLNHRSDIGKGILQKSNKIQKKENLL